MAPWWIRQLPVFGSISPTASSGSALWLTVDPPVEQHHRRHVPVGVPGDRARRHRRAAGSAGSSSAVGDLRRDHRLAGPRPVHRLGRLAPPPLGRLPAVVPVRGDPVRRGDAPLPASTSRVARSSTPRSGSRRAPTSSALEGVAALVGCDRPAPAVVALRVRDHRAALGGRRVRRRLRRALRPDRPARLADGGAIAAHALAEELDRLGVPRTDRLMTIDAAGFKYFDGPAGRRLAGRPDRHDPRRRAGLRHPLARARAGSASRPSSPSSPASSAGMDRPARLRRSRRPTAGSRPTSRSSRSASRPTTSGARVAAQARPMTRREAWLTAVGLFAVALLVRAVFAAQIVFPKPEDTAYYVGVARNLRRGPRPRVGRAVELPDAAAGRSRDRRSRSGCRCRRSSPRVPMAAPRPDVPRRPGRVRRRSARSSRSSPGGWPPTSPSSAACRRAGRGRSRSGPG